MSATIVLTKTTGASPGSETVVTGVSAMSTDSSINTSPQRIAYPIEIPAAGSEYSYENWLAFKCTGAPDTQAYNFKVWGPASQPETGVTVWVKSAAAYQTPAEPASTAGFTRQDTNYYDSSHYLTVSGTLTVSGDVTDYFVVMVQVASTASPGAMTAVTVNYSYKEQ